MMKKIKLLLLSVLVLLVFPLVVFADGAAPTLQGYQVRVTNPDGAKGLLYDWKTKTYSETTIPYDTVIDVYMEMVYEGELYGETYYDENIVRLSDCTLVKEELEIQEGYKASGKIYVIKEGTYLYKGPSKVYGKVTDTMIPVGTTLTYTYYDGIFAYVSYKGEKGWVYTGEDVNMYEDEITVVLYSSLDLTTFGEFKMYKEADDKSNVVGTLPSGKEIKTIYEYAYNCDRFAEKECVCT